MKLADARRVVLFHLDPETQIIEFRHYSVGVKATGISKSVKTIIQTNIPDLNKFDDISDYVLK
jgi:ribosome biogenesis protein SSF1/2